MYVILPVVHRPSSKIQGCEKNQKQYEVLEHFNLIWWKQEWTSKDQCKSVDDYAKGE